MKKQFYLTKDGLNELKDELAALIASRSQISDNIRTAREFGDLTENSEYQSAREAQDKNEARITEIEYILKSADIIKTAKSNDKVVLGAHVTLKNGSTKQFQVVSTVEADPLEGKISDESPIGQALLGKKVGDEVEIKTPAEVSIYKITAIA